MKKRLTILVAVAAAVTIVLWLKPRAAREPVAPDTPASAPASSSELTDTSAVLLFADPREAEESCGCAEIIQLVRGAKDIPNIAVREIDSRHSEEDARRYGVRISPSVVILDAAGEERARFEGESPAVIQALRTALDDLRHPRASAASGEPQ
ncbi:MAG: hypothetical protein ACC742_04370 [Thermoanaerobaculales bacterium]